MRDGLTCTFINPPPAKLKTSHPLLKAPIESFEHISTQNQAKLNLGSEYGPSHLLANEEVEIWNLGMQEAVVSWPQISCAKNSVVAGSSRPQSVGITPHTPGAPYLMDAKLQTNR